MEDELNNKDQKQISEFDKKKKKLKSYFWALFITYLIFFVFIWGGSMNEFGLFYIFGVGCFVSFFLAWATCLFILLLKQS